MAAPLPIVHPGASWRLRDARRGATRQVQGGREKVTQLIEEPRNERSTDAIRAHVAQNVQLSRRRNKSATRAWGQPWKILGQLEIFGLRDARMGATRENCRAVRHFWSATRAGERRGRSRADARRLVNKLTNLRTSAAPTRSARVGATEPSATQKIVEESRPPRAWERPHFTSAIPCLSVPPPARMGATPQFVG